METLSKETSCYAQAIFTSTRTAMGEGYRLIAASQDLRPNEKQVITRFSPSHNGLCAEHSEPDNPHSPIHAAAFYPLPTGRLCVALSYPAGAEHTGRGGQRVYTHIIVIEAEDLAAWDYNPFNILRAMAAAGLASPQLKPPVTLPNVDLRPYRTDNDMCVLMDNHALMACGRRVLHSLFQNQRVIVNTPSEWVDTTEALLLGIPGPLRATLSFSAGLRFSASRGCNLALLIDEKGTVKARIAGHAVNYIDPDSLDNQEAPTSNWLTFVVRHWNTGSHASLARRTSRAFVDFDLAARERIGQLYNAMDDIPNQSTSDLLTETGTNIGRLASSQDSQIVTEWLDRARDVLNQRFANAAWPQTAEHWPTLLDLARVSQRGTAFAVPLMECLLNVAMAQHPLEAAEAALDLAQMRPSQPLGVQYPDVIDQVLNRLADWAGGGSQEQRERLRTLAARWSLVRPDCPNVKRLSAVCSAEVPLQVKGQV